MGDPFSGLVYPSEFSLVQDSRMLTAREREVIGNYTAGDYLPINRSLRGQRRGSSQVQADIATLRSAIEKFPLDRGYRVSRETEMADIGLAAGETPQRLVGDSLEELGFLSTSGLRRPPRIVDRDQPVWLDLALPTGVPALLLTEDLTRASASEREVLVIDARRMFVADVNWSAEEQLWIVQAIVDPEV